MRLFNSLPSAAVLLALGCSGGPDTVSLDWRVTSNPMPLEFLSLAGAKVCVDDHPEVECQLTDADGLFSLSDLPADTDVVLTVEKRGYLPAIKLLHTELTNAVVSQALVMLREDQLPTDQGEIDLKGAGVVSFFAFDFPPGVPEPRNLAGVKVSLSPETEASPIYLGVDGKPDPSLDGTAADDKYFTGGLFLNVPPGDYKLKFTPPAGYSCLPLGLSAWGVPIEGEQAVRITVRAGYFTTDLGMDCLR